MRVGVVLTKPLDQSPTQPPSYFPQQQGPANESTAEPVTEIDVHFTGAYAPGGKFSVILDDTRDLTKTFAPPPGAAQHSHGSIHDLLFRRDAAS